MSEYRIPIETALMPAYYKDFHCLMGACRYSCCSNWKIEFDKKDYLAIKRAAKSPALEELTAWGVRRLREKAHDGKYAEFCMTQSGDCAFHTPEGLCALQLECGEETLPQICRQFPRQEHVTTMAREWSLSPACEGVLALLWDLPEGIDFVEEPLASQACGTVKVSSAAEARFADIRSLCIDVLQCRLLGLPQRMLLLGLLLHRLRGVDWNNEETVDRWLNQSSQLLQDPSAVSGLQGLPRDQRAFLSHNLRVLVDMSSSLDEKLVWELLHVSGVHEGDSAFITNEQRYQQAEAKTEEFLRPLDYFFENLMVTVIFRLAFPGLNSPEALWRSYVNLCNLYGFYRFVSVCGCDQAATQERLFQVLVFASRQLIHNTQRRNDLREELFQNDSATLAHMAILVGS